MGSLPQPTELDRHALEKFRELLANINKEIHSNPELAYTEHRAHDTICDALASLGYKVTRHAFGIKTSFQAEYGHGGAVIAFNAEYDALPDIGHACGHNLIATSSVAAFLLVANHLAKTGIEGRVRLLGTPAEEDGGGKIDLIKAGAYKDIDACLMGHPGPSGDGWGVVLPRLMARSSVQVTFRGVNAHAGNAPWQGKNALDAAVAAYNNIAMLRQQTPPNRRLHAIISKGGDRPNVIPHLTEISLYVRGETAAEVAQTCERIVDCCEGAAKATACTVEFHWDKSYKELQCNEVIAKCFEQNALNFNQTYRWTWDRVSGASTDQGNVSYEVPSLHPCFGIPVEKQDVGPHHPDFEHAAGQPEALEAAMTFAYLLAATGVDILQDSTKRKDMWAEHRLRFGSAC